MSSHHVQLSRNIIGNSILYPNEKWTGVLEFLQETREFVKHHDITILDLWDGKNKGRFYFDSEAVFREFEVQIQISKMLLITFDFDGKYNNLFRILKVLELPPSEAFSQETAKDFQNNIVEMQSVDQSIQTADKTHHFMIDRLYLEYLSLTYGAQTENMTGTVLCLKPLQTVNNVHYFWARVRSDGKEMKVYFFGPNAYQNIEKLREKRVYSFLRILQSKSNDSRGSLEDLCYYFGKDSRIVEQKTEINKYGTMEEPWRKPTGMVSISELPRLKNGEIISLKGRIVSVVNTDPKVGIYDVQLTDGLTFCTVKVFDSNEQPFALTPGIRLELQRYTLGQILPFPILIPNPQSQIKLTLSQNAIQTQEQNNLICQQTAIQTGSNKRVKRS